MSVSSDQICEELLLLLHHIKHCLHELGEQQGLTRVQLYALYAIDQQGELAMGMGQFADVLNCDASNVTGIVDRLVAQGLITREACAHDRRAKTLQLTDKGRQTIRTIRVALPGALGCGTLSSAERDALHAILSKLFPVLSASPS